MYQMKAPNCTIHYHLFAFQHGIKHSLLFFPAGIVIVLVGPGSSSQKQLCGSVLSHVISRTVNKVLLLAFVMVLAGKKLSFYIEACMTL